MLSNFPKESEKQELNVSAWFYFSTNSPSEKIQTIKSIVNIPQIAVHKEIEWIFDYEKKILKINDDDSKFLKNLAIIHFVEIKLQFDGKKKSVKKGILEDLFAMIMHQDDKMVFVEYTFLNEFKKPLMKEADNLGGNLGRLLRGEEYADLTLECEGGILKAHRIIMSARSDYFKKMLESETIEAKLNTVKCAYSVKTMGAMLHYIYTDEVNALIAKDLFIVADYYQIPSLKSDCLDSIKEDIRAGNVLSTLAFAQNNDEEMLKTCCHWFIREYGKNVFEADELLNFPERFSVEKWDLETVRIVLRSVSIK